MPNTYFQFKKFTIHQDNTAMKVTTEACLFGAWVQTFGARHILDIGTGTGLLTLMLAQKTTSETQIHAVEMDKSALEQAKENISKSPWASRVRIFHQRIQDFQSVEGYDFIICNPPFFDNHLTSSNIAKNQALHQVSLSFEELLNAVGRLLNPNGYLAVLLPTYEMDIFRKLAHSRGFFPRNQLTVYNRPQKPIFRQIIIFAQQEMEIQREEVLIREDSQEYSKAFRELLKDFYLNL